jgi:hypothetical protein
MEQNEKTNQALGEILESLQTLKNRILELEGEVELQGIYIEQLKAENEELRKNNSSQ